MHEPSVLLIDATLPLIDAAIARDHAQLSALLDAEIAAHWEGFPEALPRLRTMHEALPAGEPWGTVLFLLREPRTLIGMGGYKGAPSPEGVVEIGYAIAPAFQRRGLATSAARALVERALRDARARTVRAHTLPELNASVRVLQKLGFVREDEHAAGRSDGVWAHRLDRDAMP